MIDENLIFVSLITIFLVFIIHKQPYLIGILSLITVFYYLYKGRFTNPKDFFTFMINKTKEAFEPCSAYASNSAYCGTDTTNSNMTFLPEIVRSAPVNKQLNNINNNTSVILKIEDYQIDRRLNFNGAQITIDQIIASVPILIDFKIYLDRVIKFILEIQTDDLLQKDFLAKKICNKMTKIFYNAYNTVNDNKYPINTYNELLYAQNEFNSTMNIFIFLGMTDTNTKKLETLQKEFHDLCDKLNSFIVEKVNDIQPNDYNITTSFLPQKNEPQGVSIYDYYINL
jgi:hypothetical protein